MPIGTPDGLSIFIPLPGNALVPSIAAVDGCTGDICLYWESLVTPAGAGNLHMRINAGGAVDTAMDGVPAGLLDYAVTAVRMRW